MVLLNEFEQRQSGVQAIQRRLQEMEKGFLGLCGAEQSPDTERDWMLLQQNRAKRALVSRLLDEIGEKGDNEEMQEG